MLKKDAVFLWEPHHAKQFEDIKDQLSEQSLLHYYDPAKPATLHCDASIKGLGAALLQPDAEGNLKPVAYASKSLTPTEQRYACIEREMLAIVFGVQRFHTYLYGRKFTVVTDHKPLVMIMDKAVTAAPARLQRMLLLLHGYNMVLEFVKGADHQLADGLSRLPSQEEAAEIELDVRVDAVRFAPHKLEEVREEVAKDPALTELKDCILEGWPEQVKDLPTEIRPYWGVRDQLAICDGVIFRGEQVVIPPTLKDDILQKLHTSHLGREKTRLLARDSVFWPGITKDIQKHIGSCEQCQKYQPSQTPEPLLQHETPSRPWCTLATDIFQIDQRQYIIIADYFSKYPVIRKLPRPCSSAGVIDILQATFSEQGIPEKLISDNGPHFASEQFKSFADEWGFQHTTTSPHRPQGNGFIERQIRTAKAIIKKAKESGTNAHLALLHWRATPVSSDLPSPAQSNLGRKVRTIVTSKAPSVKPENMDAQEALRNRQACQKKQHDRRALPMDLPELQPEQQVLVQHPVSGTWEPATVKEKKGQREYIVQLNGKLYKRNRQHLRSQHSSELAKQPTRRQRSGRATRKPARYEQ